MSVWKRILLGTWLVVTTDAGAQTSPTVPTVPSTEGVTPGMTVVTVGQTSLKDGDTVEVVKSEDIVASAAKTASID